MKRLVLLIVMTLVSIGLKAQYNRSNRQSDNQRFGLDKFYFGGGGGFGAGTGYNYYSLLPVVGYQITDQYSVGVSLTYQRYNYPISGYSFTQYGLGPFMRYTFNPFFFQGEFDVINAPAYNNNNELVRSNYSRLLFGVGYLAPVGKRSKINALAMYDVLYKVPSVFNSPIVLRIYFIY